MFEHPCTITVSAPSGSGKSYLVMKMLQQGKFKPKPDRIVVLYKRWQPLYTEMKNTIPNIEFIQGVPQDLDDDKFFDVT